MLAGLSGLGGNRAVYRAARVRVLFDNRTSGRRFVGLWLGTFGAGWALRPIRVGARQTGYVDENQHRSKRSSWSRPGRLARRLWGVERLGRGSTVAATKTSVAKGGLTPTIAG